MATFQERINQFRQGLDTQQNHFNDAMGMASDYGRQVLEDKLGQHYENIEKVGGTVMSAGLALGSAKNTFKSISAKYRAMKSGKPQAKAPTEQKADIQMTEPQFEPAEREGEKEAPAPQLAEGQANKDPLEEVKNTVEDRVARGEPQDEFERDEFGLPELPKEPSPLDRLSGLAKDADELPIQGFKQAPPLPPSRQPAQPAEPAEPSFEDQMASLRSQVQSIGKQSASMTPADTEALNQRTAQQLQSLGGRKLGGAGTDDPALLQESELGQRTAYTGSRGFTPREAPPLPPSRQPVARGADDSGTLADIQNLSDLPAREIAGASRVIKAGGFNPANAKPNTGSGTAVKGTPTGTGTAEQMSAQTTQLAEQVEQRAGEGLAAGKSLLGGIAEGGATVAAQALGGSKNVAEKDIGAVAGGSIATKQVASAGKKLAQKAGVVGEDTTTAVSEPTTALGKVADTAGQSIIDATGALKTGVSNAIRSGLSSFGLEEGTVSGIMAAGGIAAEAVPVIGDLVGAGMLIYGLVKDFKHQKSTTPQLTAPQLETTQQAGGLDTKALGGSQNTGGGIV
jgi:hypothetical protein